MRLPLVVVIVLVLLFSCSCGPAPRPADVDLKRVGSTIADRVEFSVQIRNDYAAFVKEVRRVSLSAGYQELQFIDVSDGIEAESVQVSVRDSSSDVVFSEQNYTADLMTPERITELSIGREVRVYLTNETTGEERAIKGILRSGPDGLIVESEDGFTIIGPNARIELDEVPGGIQPLPVLSWLTYCEKDVELEIETSYITDGLYWEAEYGIYLDQEGKTANVRAVAIIDNETNLKESKAMVELSFGEADLFTFNHPYPMELKPRTEKQIPVIEAGPVTVSNSVVVLIDLVATRDDGRLGTGLRLSLEHSGKTALNTALPEGHAIVWQEDRRFDHPVKVGQNSVSGAQVGEPFCVDLGENSSVDGFWVSQKAKRDSDGRVLLDGTGTLKNRTDRQRDVIVEMTVTGNSDVQVEVDGKKAKKLTDDIWEVRISLGPEEHKTINIRTRP